MTADGASSHFHETSVNDFALRLCNFHEVMDESDTIGKNPRLKLFIFPLWAAFKCVLNTFNPNLVQTRIIAFNNWVNSAALPIDIVTLEDKNELIQYASSSVFAEPHISSIALYNSLTILSKIQRRDTLAFLNNPSEAIVKSIGMVAGHGRHWKGIFQGLCDLRQYMQRMAIDVKHEIESPSRRHIQVSDSERAKAQRGLLLLRSDKGKKRL